jgi:hypothetical protein
MKYMLMLFEQDTDWDAVPEAERTATLDEHGAFIAYLKKRGIEFSGEALRPSTTATTLRPAGPGQDLLVTDGPYVELKENLAGYYVVDAADLDDAIEIARHCPTGTGTEIRPLWDTGM